MPEVSRRFPERHTGKDRRKIFELHRFFCKCKFTLKESNKVTTFPTIKPANILP